MTQEQAQDLCKGIDVNKSESVLVCSDGHIFINSKISDVEAKAKKEKLQLFYIKGEPTKKAKDE